MRGGSTGKGNARDIWVFAARGGRKGRNEIAPSEIERRRLLRKKGKMLPIRMLRRRGNGRETGKKKRELRGSKADTLTFWGGSGKKTNDRI